MQAKELPIKDIQYKEYFCIAYRNIYDYPLPEPVKWNPCISFYETEEKADLWIIEQKKYQDKPGFMKQEFKKFSILLPV